MSTRDLSVPFLQLSVNLLFQNKEFLKVGMSAGCQELKNTHSVQGCGPATLRLDKKQIST